jgi:Flp pilus assembly pilin Flp
MLAMYAYLSVRSLLTRIRHDQRGQATAEYALVLLGAAAVALLVVGWATHTDLIGKLLDTVMNNLTGKVK